MPFTPLHMGPGMLLKSVLGSAFSLMIFGWSQILMDLQPLWVLLTGSGHLHGFSHTYVGASLIAVVACYSGRFLLGLLVQNQWLGISPETQNLLQLNVPLRSGVLWFSAYLGCWSHVLLDSFMHGDMVPWMPFSGHNPFLHRISYEALHAICIGSGLLGGAIYLYSLWRIRLSARRGG